MLALLQLCSVNCTVLFLYLTIKTIKLYQYMFTETTVHRSTTNSAGANSRLNSQDRKDNLRIKIKLSQTAMKMEFQTSTESLSKARCKQCPGLKGVRERQRAEDRAPKRLTKVWIWETRKQGLVRKKKVDKSFERSYIIFLQGASVSLLTLVTSGEFRLTSSPALRTHPTEH